MTTIPMTLIRPMRTIMGYLSLSVDGVDDEQARSMSATTTSVPTGMLASGSSGMANHSSPRARIRPGWCAPSISLVTKAVSPTIPWTPLSTAAHSISGR